MSESKTTKDHAEIQRWTEARGGRPATVSGTGRDGEAGVLRLDFDPQDSELKKISWQEFFEKFDSDDLSFLYQDKTLDGKISRFHKFIRE
jgi:hypothetical protein